MNCCGVVLAGATIFYHHQSASQQVFVAQRPQACGFQAFTMHQPPGTRKSRRDPLHGIIMAIPWFLAVGIPCFFWYKLSDSPGPPAGAAVLDVEGLKAAAKLLDPELMEHMPQRFSSGYRSPCWQSNQTLHCLPAFLMLGGFQSAQPHIWSMLARHPALPQHGPVSPHFWAEREKRWTWLDHELQPLIQQVQGNPQMLVPDVSESTYAFYASANGRLHRQQVDTVVKLQHKCPGAPAANRTACMQHVWSKGQEVGQQVAGQLGMATQDLILPLLMRAAYGDQPPRLIAVVRAPTARLHAAYYAHPHYHTHFKTSGGVRNYTSMMKQALDNCILTHGIKACAINLELLGYEYEQVWFHADQLLRGMHWVWLEGWLKYFGENLMVVFTEEFLADERGTLERILTHLGLPPLTQQQWQGMLAAKTPDPELQPQEPLPADVEQALGGFYAPHNVRLGQLLFGKSVCPWSQQLWKSGRWVAGGGVNLKAGPHNPAAVAAAEETAGAVAAAGAAAAAAAQQPGTGAVASGSRPGLRADQ